MPCNQFGRLFTVTTFGESHGAALGAVIDGCPAGVVWRQEVMDTFLERRRPGARQLTSARQEADKVQILSGVFEGKTLGTPIAGVIFNQDAKSNEYTPEKLAARPGHATDLWHEKFGHSDPRGSGRASGRETVSRVIAGSIAKMFVTQLHPELTVYAFTESAAGISMTGEEIAEAIRILDVRPEGVDEFSLRCPNGAKNSAIERMLTKSKESGESHGGVAQVRMTGVPRGLGQPVFAKLKSDLSSAFMSTGATMGFEIGAGFASAQASGHEFHKQDLGSSNYGGLRGGISTGEPVVARVAFKPASSRKEMAVQGRHDPCIVPRAIPVLEAMAWLVLADQLLLTRIDRI